MIANYHTHTVRCRHAKGTEREYIEQAIANGLKVLGFSDHAPYLFYDSVEVPEGAYYSNMRMRPEEFRDYCDTLVQLREEYKDRIRILIGLEMEYYPAHFQRTRRWMKDFPVDYLILGQHFLGNEQNAPYSGAKTNDEATLARYVDQVIAGLKTGCFSYVAHPDLLCYTGRDRIYTAHMTRLCKAMKAAGAPAELNLLGFEQHRSYPNPRFWELVAETGCPCVLGCDAHVPAAVAKPHIIANARQYLSNFRLTPLETVPLKNPFAGL